MRMNNRALRFLAVIGQLITVMPFVVLCDAVGFDGFVWWHCPAMYGVIILFWLLGRLCGSWGMNPRHSRSFRPKAAFLSRSAFAVPVIAFFIVCGGFGLSSALYIYLLPAAIIMFFGGHSSCRKEYTDIFTRGWFALYFVAAVISNVIIWFTREEELIAPGSFLLCFGFGALIIIAAVLTNQTNIDTCTHQRDAGKQVLPQGLRRYNAWLVAAVVSVTVVLFLFTKPVAELLFLGVKQIILLLLWLFTRGGEAPENNVLTEEGGSGGLAVSPADNSFAQATTLLLIAGIAVILFLLRKPIAELLRTLFAPLFRVSETVGEAAYSDEVTEVPSTSHSAFSRRRTEQQLYRLFRKETDPSEKYRLGYKLMLLRLEDTPFHTVPTDNTDIHRVKGENGLRNDKVERIVQIYNDVRYKGRVPAAEEITFAESFIEEIRR